MRTLISILWISFFPLAAAAQGDDLSYRLKKVIKDKKAEIGIAVILDAQDTVTVNNDDRYPLAYSNSTRPSPSQITWTETD